MSTIDVLILLGFVAYAAASGFRSRRVAGRNLEEYFLAGRTLPGWKAGLSMAATQFAADTPLLVTGLIATAGIFSLWRLWIYALAFLLMGFVLAPSWRRAGVITDAELTEVRYGSRPAALLRGVKAFYFGTVFNCTVMAMVLLAATRIAEPFLTWNAWLPPAVFGPVAAAVEWIGVPITVVPADPAAWPAEVWILSANNVISIFAILLVTTFYSATGGLRSVVNTDVVQFAIMMVSTALFAWIVADRLGGFSAIPERIAERFAGGGPGGITPDQLLAFTPSLAKEAGAALLAVFAIQWIAQMNADGTGYLAQRSMACRSDRDASRAAVVFTFAQVLLRSLLWLPIGLGLLLLFPPAPELAGEALRAEREATFVLGIDRLLPAGIKGLMLTGMLAALASTVDTHLNWGSSYWTNDLYKRFVCQAWRGKEPSGRSLVWVARGANLLILTIALVIMTQLGSIQTAWQASLLLGAGLGVVLVLRWVWWRLSAAGELASILTSLLLAPVLLAALPAEDEALRLLIMAGAATLAGVGASLLFGPEDSERLKAFYLRARPPGFWRPVSEALGHDAAADRRRLGRGLAAVALAAVSLFSLLVGLGTWLVGSPAPAWLPWRSAWIAALLVFGLALVPLWWRLGLGGGAPEGEPAARATDGEAR